ncbi:MAG TPA: polysaccharide biosynthesis C-terminal domain-containing protein, partial [Bacteroidales bacterium]|nr:polysaccharide biosynthesis C-terminal domain-containing protein [Bacteroidales bacterium]
MELLYNDHVEESARVYSLLVPGLVAFSASYIFGTLLTANGNLRILNLIAGAGMVVNILLNIMLIPRYQATGSAFASLVTLMLSAILQMVISVRKFALVPSRSQWIRSLLFLSGVFAIMWIQQFLPWEWYLRMGMAALAILVLAFSIRFIQPVQLYRILLRTAP